MDPISLIMVALAAGATASLQTTASDAVKDTYTNLKILLQRRFVGKPKAEAVLADHEDDPETYRLPLQKVLLHEHVYEDEEIVKAAQQLMTLVHPQQAARGRFNVWIAHTYS